MVPGQSFFLLTPSIMCESFFAAKSKLGMHVSIKSASNNYDELTLTTTNIVDGHSIAPCIPPGLAIGKCLSKRASLKKHLHLKQIQTFDNLTTWVKGGSREG